MNFIEYWASIMLERQSFDFASFQEARDRLESVEQGYTKYCEYDRFSLIIKEHNLTKAERDLLFFYLRKTWVPRARKDCEYRKQTNEYSNLYLYFKYKSYPSNTHIQKKTHPDFVVLHKEKNIGIEVTELTEGSDKILGKISDLISVDTTISPEAARILAKTKFKEKANNYTFESINGHTLVGSGVRNITDKNNAYTELIYRKYQKYAAVMSQYDEFIILCDLKNAPFVGDKDDVIEIIDPIKHDHFENDFKVALIYTQNYTGAYYILEYNIKTKRCRYELLSK